MQGSSERIGELRGEKEALEEALAGIGAERQDAEDEELAEQLARLPDLAEALREAPAEIQAPVVRVIRPADRLRQGRAPR